VFATVRAGDTAMIACSRGDHRLAEQLIRMVRQRGLGGVEADLALANVEVEGPGRTDRGLARFAAIAGTPGHAPTHLAAAAEGRAVALLTGHGDTDGARRVARAAHQAYPGDAIGVRCGALAACLDVLLGDVEAGVELAADLPDLGDRVLSWVVATAQAVTRTVAGDLEVAAACLERCPEPQQDPACTVPEHLLPLWATLARGVAATVIEVGRGRLPLARARAAAATDRAERRAPGARLAPWHAITAYLAIVGGDLATAERSATAAASAAEPHDPWSIGPISRCQLALIAAQRGAVYLADERLAELDAGGLGAHPWLEVDRCRALAWNEFAGGRSVSAAKLALEAGELALMIGRPLDAAMAFVDVVRFGFPDLALPGVGRAEAGCPAKVPRLFVRLAGVAAAGDVAGLRQVGDALLAAGLRPLAVEAWLAAADLIAAQRSAPTEAEVVETEEGLRRRARDVLDRSAVVPITAARAQAGASKERKVAAQQGHGSH
jgi:hypothetical protein